MCSTSCEACAAFSGFSSTPLHVHGGSAGVQYAHHVSAFSCFKLRSSLRDQVGFHQLLSMPASNSIGLFNWVSFMRRVRRILSVKSDIPTHVPGNWESKEELQPC